MNSRPMHHKESPLFAADRSGYWHQMRDLGPVVEIADGNPMLRGYYLTRRDDVRAALLDPETFASPPKTFKIGAPGNPLPQVPLACQTRADHARFGRLLHPLFSPKALAPYELLVRERAATSVAAIAAKGQCDAVGVVDAFALQALLVVCGIPPEDPRAGRLIKAAVVGDANGKAEVELISWLNSVLIGQVGNPDRPPGILWPLLEALASESDLPISKAEGVAVVLLLFSVAGIEMVAAALGFALLRLARDPGVRDRLREDPAQVPAFVEEVLRLESPGPAIPRMATRDVTIGGVTIPAGSAVWLGLEAAGREDGGDEMCTTSTGQIQRQRHWAFGAGMHRCLGMHLARLEMAAFVTEWLARIPQFELDPAFTLALVHKPTGVSHLYSLMLRWEVQ